MGIVDLTVDFCTFLLDSVAGLLHIKEHRQEDQRPWQCLCWKASYPSSGILLEVLSMEMVLFGTCEGIHNFLPRYLTSWDSRRVKSLPTVLYVETHVKTRLARSTFTSSRHFHFVPIIKSTTIDFGSKIAFSSHDYAADICLGREHSIAFSRLKRLNSRNLFVFVHR